MTEQFLAATIVNHVAVDIAASPDAVWQMILDEYVEARKFREMGYTLEPLDDPAVVLGGYRMSLKQGADLVDDRICHVTERDEGARRLSMFADYLSVPGGMHVYATYHAQEAASGTRYALDCQSRVSIEASTAAGWDVRVAVAELKAQWDDALTRYLLGVQAKFA